MAHKNSYNSKVLCGNWFEERCTSGFDHLNFKTNTYQSNPYFTKYQTMYKDIGCSYQYKREPFNSSSDNWLNFQKKVGTDETFKTTARMSFQQPKEMKSPFELKQTYITKDPAKLEEYRDRWSRGHMDYPRTYLGSVLYKKAEKE